MGEALCAAPKMVHPSPLSGTPLPPNVLHSEWAVEEIAALPSLLFSHAQKMTWAVTAFVSPPSHPAAPF